MEPQILESQVLLLGVSLLIAVAGGLKLYQNLKKTRHDIRVMFDDWDSGQPAEKVLADAKIVFADLLVNMSDAKTPTVPAAPAA